MDNQELLQAIEAMMDKKLDDKLTPMNQRLTNIENDIAEIKKDIVVMKEDIETLKEDSTITRSAANVLLDWADRAQIEVNTPLIYKKAE